MRPGVLEQILKGRFNRVEPLRSFENVYKCPYFYRDKIAAIYFFDAEGKILEPDFDIEEYQHKYVSDEYYSYKGSVQWNMYLTFLLKEEDFKKIHDKKSYLKIASNRAFARKYIIQTSQLEEWLTSPFDQLDTKLDEPRTNIVVRWGERLDAAGLKAINSGTGIQKLVSTYLSKDSAKTKQISFQQTSVISDKSVGKLRALTLEDYRQFEKNTKYENIPDVWLLRGPNGAGKTSMLEAIELGLCGKTFRNEAENGAKLQLHSESENQITFPEDNREYRSRDEIWYNNRYTKNNYLPKRFNQYNFFDTDAAFRLSNDQDEKQLNEAFSQLALGADCNFLEKRINDSRTAFRQEFNRISKELANKEESVNELTVSLANWEKTTAPSLAFFNTLDVAFKKVNWQGSDPGSISNLSDACNLELNETVKSLRNISETLNWVNNLNLNSINEEKERLGDLSISIKKERAELIKAMQLRKESKSKIGEKEIQIELLRKIIPYLEDENIGSLQGLSNQIREFSEQVRTYQEAFKIIGTVRLEDLNWQKADINLAATLAKMEEHNDALMRKSTEALSQLEKINNASQKIDQLTSQIIAIGHSLLAENPDLTICPFCKTKHEKGELEEKISIDAAEQSPMELKLQELNLALNKNKEGIAKNKKRIENVKSIEKAGALIWGIKSVRSMKISEIESKINESKKTFISIQKKLEQANLQSELFESKGLKEEEFKNISESIKNHWPDLALNYENRSSIQARINNLEQQLSGLKVKLAASEKEIKKLKEIESAKSLNEIGEEMNFEELAIIINDRLMNISTGMEELNAIRKNIHIDNFQSLKKLRRIRLLGGQIDYI